MLWAHRINYLYANIILMFMDVLFAPARKRYSKPKKCPFCNYPKRKIIEERKTAMLIANDFPYTLGHLMVVLKRHTDRLDVTAKESKDLFELVDIAGRALKNVYKAEGFNIGANVGKVSGHSIDHFHLHIIPRHKNDSGFLDLVAHTAVLEENPKDTVRKVKTALRQK